MHQINCILVIIRFYVYWQTTLMLKDAEIEYCRGNLLVAENLYKTALSKNASKNGWNSTETARVLNRIAEICIESDSINKAIVAVNQSRELSELSNTVDSSDVLIMRCSSARLYVAKGDYKKAEQNLKLAKRIYERNTKNCKKVIPEFLETVAVVYMNRNTKDYLDTAFNALNKAQIIVSDRAEIDYLRYLSLMRHISYICYYKAKFKEGVIVCNSAIKTVGRKIQKKHPINVDLLITLADCSFKSGDYLNANKVINSAIRYEKAGCNRASRTSKCYWILSILRAFEGKYKSSKRYFQKGFREQEQATNFSDREKVIWLANYKIKLLEAGLSVEDVDLKLSALLTKLTF